MVAERLTPEEARAVARADAAAARSEAARRPAPTAPGPIGAQAVVPGPVSPPAGNPAAPSGGVVTLAPVVAAPAPALPVFDPRPARLRFSRLWSLVRGRRRECGRHRPDTIPSQGWSMFAPQRRARRRFGSLR